MNKKVVICPACGSQQTSRFEQKGFDELTLGSKYYFQEINYKCNSCGEEGDFLAENDKNYLAAQKEAQGNLVRQILENMHTANITMAMFERVFELPTRTLTRWKNGDFSASSLALLRIVGTYPWIIEVAENRFEKTYSKYALITAAAHEFKNEINPNVQIRKLEANSNTLAIYFVFKNKSEKASLSYVTTGG